MEGKTRHCLRLARRALPFLALLLATGCSRGSDSTSAPLAPDSGPVAAAQPQPAPALSAPDSGPVAVEPPRPSSFRPCPFKVRGDCDLGEVCAFTRQELLCPGGRCYQKQAGEQRCHRSCFDERCGPGETCEARTLRMHHARPRRIQICTCAGDSCPERGPGGIPRPAEGGLELWRPERGMPVDLYYHAAATSEDHLFVSGGLRLLKINGSSATLEPGTRVYSAALQEDGSLGKWRESGTLPLALYHHGMAVAGGRLYVAGGETDSGFAAEVRSAAIAEDGTLGAWREETPLPAPRGWHSLLSDGRHLLVVGGTLDKKYFSNGTPQLWRATLSKDMEPHVSRWETLTAPAPLHYDQSATLRNGRLYAVGEDGILYSVAFESGQDWRSSEDRPPWMNVNFGASGWHTVRLVALRDSLLVLMTHARAVTASLRPDGTVSGWQTASRIYGPHTSFAVTRSAQDRAYVLGGTSGTSPIERVREVWSTQRIAP